MARCDGADGAVDGLRAGPLDPHREPGFIVYAAGSEQRAEGVARDLEAFDGLLRRFTNAPAERSPTKLEVYLLSSDQFAETFPDVGRSIVGLYSARVDQIAAFATFSNAGLSGQDTLFHEYAHHFMFQHFANAYLPGTWRASPSSCPPR